MTDFIPDEMLLLAFALICPADRVTCLRVCRQWRRVAVDHTLWRAAPLEECHAPPRALPEGWVTPAQAMIIASAHASFTTSGDAAAAAASSLLRISVLVDAREDYFDWEEVVSPNVPLTAEQAKIKEEARQNCVRKLHASHSTRCAFTAIVEQCALAIRPDDQGTSFYLDILAGSALRAFAVFSTTYITGPWLVPALKRFPALQFLLVAGSFQLSVLTGFFTLPQPNLSLCCVTPAARDSSGFSARDIRSSTLRGVELHGDCLPISQGVFAPARFPCLQRLAVRSVYATAGPRACFRHQYMGEAFLFDDAAKSVELAALEELTVEITPWQAGCMRGVYPSLRRLTLYDVDGGSTEPVAKFTSDPRQQFPALEVIHTSWPGVSSSDNLRGPANWFSWWDSFLDARTGPPNFREIRTFALEGGLAMPGVSDKYDHSTTCFRDLALPMRGDEEASITHAMPAGWSLTITVRGEAIHYHGVRTVAA